MSFLDQAKQAAANVASTTQQYVSQAATAAQPHVEAATAAAQPHVQNIGSTLSSAASTAGTAAVNLANQAHAQAAKVAPTIIPAPAGTADSGVDTSHDLSPTDKVGVKKLENFLHDRPTAADLQQHNILKGAPDDPLAGKKADLMKAQQKDKLESELAHRPTASELVDQGILNPDETPPTK